MWQRIKNELRAISYSLVMIGWLLTHPNQSPIGEEPKDDRRTERQ